MSDSHQAQLNGETRTAISEGLVALLKHFYGVGPSQAKTYCYDDLVVCVLRGGFTRVEQTLLEGGARQRSSSSGWRSRIPGELKARIAKAIGVDPLA